MSQFEITKFEIVNNCTYKFYKLYVDGKCQFDEFYNEIENNAIHQKNFASIVNLMDNFSPQRLLPKTKFNHIEWNKRSDIFEFKKNDLRVYVIKIDPDIFIVTGGYKKNQTKDIARLKRNIQDFSPDNLSEYDDTTRDIENTRILDNTDTD